MSHLQNLLCIVGVLLLATAASRTRAFEECTVNKVSPRTLYYSIEAQFTSMLGLLCNMQLYYSHCLPDSIIVKNNVHKYSIHVI